MIALFTDFGHPYVGQMHAVVAARAPGVAMVDLLTEAPAFQVRHAAYLLAALVAPFPAATVFLCVVDPGVGTALREPHYWRIDGRWFVGPGNGLFDVVAKRGASVEAWRVDWRPRELSLSFHGRDLFAPVAAMLARGDKCPASALSVDREALSSLPEELFEIIFIDGFGNAMTGVQAAGVDDGAVINVGAQRLAFAPTFAVAPAGRAFWYRNALGLVEIAVNQGSAAELLGLRVGDPVEVKSR